ncbi:MAG: hypothetical protein HZB44_01545 [Actinobacteria bacterium]|nr:hypothetical protein [Actinomycetota bacterium]
MGKILTRTVIVMLVAGIISAATYYAVPVSSEPQRARGTASETALVAEADGVEMLASESADSQRDEFHASPDGERNGRHGEFSIAGGLGGFLKNGTLFAVAVLGAIGIRRWRGGKTVKSI